MTKLTTGDRLKLMSPNGKRMTLEFKENKNGEHYWVTTARNGRQNGSSLPETYKNKGDCLSNAFIIVLCGWSIVED